MEYSPLMLEIPTLKTQHSITPILQFSDLSELYRAHEQKDRCLFPSYLKSFCIHVAEAQQPKKVPRIGYLSSGDPASESARAEGIRLALRELGYIEGQNIAIEYRYAEGKRDRTP